MLINKTINDDAFVRSLMNGHEDHQVSLDKFSNLKYKTAPLSEIYHTDQCGSALMYDDQSLTASRACLKVSKNNINIMMQPNELSEKFALILDPKMSMINTTESESHLIVKNDDIKILGDDYGSYLETHYDPTWENIYVNSVVGRYVCLNGMNVQVHSKVPTWTKYSIETIRNWSPEQLLEAFRIKQEKYVDSLTKCYEQLAAVRVTRQDYIDKIIPTAVDLIYPEYHIPEFDKKILEIEDPEKLDKMQTKQGKRLVNRNNLKELLILKYETDNTQNFDDTLFKAFLALTDAETHGAFTRSKDSAAHAVSKGLNLTVAILKMSGYPINRQL